MKLLTQRTFEQLLLYFSVQMLFVKLVLSATTDVYDVSNRVKSNLLSHGFTREVESDNDLSYSVPEGLIDEIFNYLHVQPHAAEIIITANYVATQLHCTIVRDLFEAAVISLIYKANTGRGSFEIIFQQNYVEVYVEPKISKTIISLKSIAEHNDTKKHISPVDADTVIVRIQNPFTVQHHIVNPGLFVINDWMNRSTEQLPFQIKLLDITGTELTKHSDDFQAHYSFAYGDNMTDVGMVFYIS
eukprot:1127117_1